MSCLDYLSFVLFRYEAARFLVIEAKAAADTPNAKGDTPLIEAAKAGSTQVLKYICANKHVSLSLYFNSRLCASG